MGDLATAELDSKLDLVALLQELNSVLKFEVEVMLIDSRPQFDALKFGDMALFARFAIALALLVFVLSVIHDLTDRRISGRSDLDEVQTTFFGKRQGIASGNYAVLCTFIIDQTAIPNAYAFVNSEILIYV